MKKPARFKKGDVVLYFRKCPRWLVEGKSPLEKGKEYAIIDVQTWGRSTGYCLRLHNGHWWVTGECLKLSDKQPINRPGR